MVLKIALLFRESVGSLQANNELTINSCSVTFNFFPFLIARLLANVLANKSLELKLKSGT